MVSENAAKHSRGASSAGGGPLRRPGRPESDHCSPPWPRPRDQESVSCVHSADPSCCIAGTFYAVTHRSHMRTHMYAALRVIARETGEPMAPISPIAAVPFLCFCGFPSRFAFCYQRLFVVVTAVHRPWGVHCGWASFFGWHRTGKQWPTVTHDVQDCRQTCPPRRCQYHRRERGISRVSDRGQSV